jgi:cyclase
VFLDITATHEKRATIVELARRTAERGVRAVHDRWWHPLGRGCAGGAGRRAPTRSRSTAPRSAPGLLDELAAQFGAQCVVLAIDAKAPRGRQLGRARARRAHRDAHDVVSWAREASSAAPARSC